MSEDEQVAPSGPKNLAPSAGGIVAPSPPKNLAPSADEVLAPSAEQNSRAALALIVATLLWGGTFVVIRDTVAALPPLPLVFGRFALASVLLAALALARRVRLDRVSLFGGVVAGLLGAMGFLFQAIGLQSTSAGSSAFLTCAGALVAGPFAWLLLRERPSRALLGGLALALIGCALLSLRQGLALGVGECWTLAGALAFGLQVVAFARYAPRADPLGLAAVQALVLAASLAPFAWSRLGVYATLHAGGWARFAYLVVPAGAIAPLLQIFAQRTLPAGRVGLLLALEPVFALAFALSFGAERFVPRWWFGAALILSAVAWVETDSLRTRRPASA